MLLNAVEQSLIPIKYSWQHVTVAKKPKASLGGRWHLRQQMTE